LWDENQNPEAIKTIKDWKFEIVSTETANLNLGEFPLEFGLKKSRTCGFGVLSLLFLDSILCFAK